MYYSFLITVPSTKKHYTAALASHLTAHAVQPNGESVLQIIQRFEEVNTPNFIHVETPEDIKKQIEKIGEDGYESSLSKGLFGLDLEAPSKEPICNTWTAQSAHLVILEKMFQDGEIVLLNRVSYTPIDKKIASFKHRDANLDFPNFQKFANRVSVEVRTEEVLAKPKKGSPSEAASEINPRLETTYQNIIGALLNLIKNKKLPNNLTQEWIIGELEDSGLDGTSRSKLSTLFPMAKKSFNTNKNPN